MSSAALNEPRIWTPSDLLAEFGELPLSRVWHDPGPGTASEADVLEIHSRTERLCELVDGVLVEKTMGSYESFLAMKIGIPLGTFVHANKLGVVLGVDGMLHFRPRLIRIPDVAFLSWDRLPGRKAPRDPVWKIVPNLAVEVISASNTRQEMNRKLDEYFELGVELVWSVYPEPREVVVYSSRAEQTTIGIDGHLDGGSVLPGFRLSLAELFADEPGP